MGPASAAIACSSAIAAGGASLEVSSPGQAPVPLAARGAGAEELSGIAWVESGRFLLVGDGGQQAVWEAWIDIDPSSGRILGQSITARIPVPGIGSDVEGIAIDRVTGTLLAADESSGAIRRSLENIDMAAVGHPEQRRVGHAFLGVLFFA